MEEWRSIYTRGSRFLIFFFNVLSVGLHRSEQCTDSILQNNDDEFIFTTGRIVVIVSHAFSVKKKLSKCDKWIVGKLMLCFWKSLEIFEIWWSHLWITFRMRKSYIHYGSCKSFLEWHRGKKFKLKFIFVYILIAAANVTKISSSACIQQHREFLAHEKKINIVELTPKNIKKSKKFQCWWFYWIFYCHTLIKSEKKLPLLFAVVCRHRPQMYVR